MATTQVDMSTLLPFATRSEYSGDDGHLYLSRTRHEQRMCQLLNAVRDKPDWARKWRTEEIRAKWTVELRALAQQGNWTVGAILARRPEGARWWSAGRLDEIPLGPMGDANFQAVLNELDFQAEHVADAAGPDNVFAQDDAVDENVRATLAQLVADQLENVPAARLDWHPRSNNQVLDLVHPSLYPLVYGRTRILKSAMDKLDDWSQFLGQGEPLRKPAGVMHAASNLGYSSGAFTSDRFQWLPSVFHVAADGAVTIGSYINNLRPDMHGALYPLLARVFEAALPLLENVVSRIQAPVPLRIEPDPYSWYGEGPHWSDREARDAWYNTRMPAIPNPPERFDQHSAIVPPFSLRDRSLKVITKLANIQLSPANPKYPGGSWHIEGMLNESIIATAIYYWDVENITESKLQFRSGVQAPTYEQSDDRGIQYAYALYNNGPLVQNRGFITARQGRLVAFPNLYQHQVAPFELADPTRSGHRKIIAFFLVDPISPLGQEVVTTAQVPPQQAEWIADVWAQDPTFPLTEKLPREVLDMIVEKMDVTMTRKEAMALRLELMDERTDFVTQNDVSVFGGAQFSLCEH
ncbi:hypothetical protein AMAG_07611 [Allomyces macrogynus ATCC 38327]|uniref:Uncharacterized protein n=1 Tax=Allomyces macrogynus (strain ATCC 38327) TaxID=578462 RepID=A0A0L0SIX9_ALLM3|nr:hypothetical protein AMAG_07611 [Allomyces macrogynus ATCC 38327]|eukprot:KNE62389.1 hypothetical protein AMAG_07611 [Allomyces macrogynus ATCC 38327]